MCVLRVPIDVRGLTFLRLYTDDVEKDPRFELAAALGAPAEFTDAEISETEAILQRLVGASLVQRRYDEEKCEDFYDLHRVIEEFLQGEYRDELPRLLESVYKFYCTGKTVDNPQSLKDLQAVLEAQHFAFRLGNYPEAYYLIPDTYLTRWGYWNLSKELYEQILPYVEGERRSYCLVVLGGIHWSFGNWDLAEKYFKDVLAIAEKEDNKRHIAGSLAMLGHIEEYRGNWDEAEKLYRQALEMITELGPRSGMASCWESLGDIERKRGNWDEAEKLYRQCLEVETELDDREGIATSIGCLGENELARGNLDTAEQRLTEALGKMQKLGMTWRIAEVNYDLARLERKRGNTEVAQQHYDTAHQIFQQLGAAKDLERIDREWHKSD
jgi:tetratricopeptide (TPR) repeat protein